MNLLHEKKKTATTTSTGKWHGTNEDKGPDLSDLCAQHTITGMKCGHVQGMWGKNEQFPSLLCLCKRLNIKW